MQPPKIDGRDNKALIERMKEMAPFYTPEWRFTPEDPDPGTALFLLFAEMLSENVRRLNRLPAKHFLAFMNMLDVSLLPARPAHANLSFRLNDGVTEPVIVPAGTQVAAPAADGDGEVLFETDYPLLLTPAAIVAAFATSIRQDRIVRIPDLFITAANAGSSAPAQLFAFKTGVNLQEHGLYLEHGYLFDIEHSARIELELGHSFEKYRERDMCALLADRRLAEWSYRTEEGWTPFDDVRAETNRIVLTKVRKLQLVESEVDGVAGRWIRCRVRNEALAGSEDEVKEKAAKSRKPTAAGRASVAAPALVAERSQLPALLAARLEFDSIALKTDYIDAHRQGGLTPAMMFYNDIQLDPAGFYPFGDIFAPYSTFYMASREAFGKRGATVGITFSLETKVNRLQTELEKQIDWKLIMKKKQFEKQELPPVAVAQVIWEYWNGNSWVRLTTKKEYDELFYKPGERSVRKVTFRVPADLQESYVNAQSDYWIRVRVLQVENMYSTQADYLSPWIEELKLTYQYGDRKLAVERCMTHNNMEYADRTALTQAKGQAFAPFYPPQGKHAALYVAFDRPPVKGPIGLYVSVRQTRLTERDVPLTEWEYWNGGETQGWRPLKVIDGTNGLTQSGMVQFAGPPDLAKARLFLTEAYWLRVVVRDDTYDDPAYEAAVPIVNGLYLNTVRAVQQESVTDEHPEKRGTEYILARTPVFGETVWVDEAEQLTEEEAAELLASETLPAFAVRDEGGRLQQLWVQWAGVDSFADSGPNDRHYALDRTTGILRFGDGVRGMAAPDTGLERVRASYKVTQGSRGNVGPMTITGMQQSIAFVGGAFNPELASGGSDTESLEEAMKRGPQLLRHRDRAVGAGDYEWLAREAYPGIAKVKCLAGRNARMEPEVGSITLVALAKDGMAGRSSFPELKRRVERYIGERAPNVVAVKGKFQVVEPAYLEISISAQLAASGIEQVVEAERAALERLERFLDPLGGGYDGQGWAIGQQLHLSVFYALLKSIPAVNHVEKLYMTVHKLEYGERIEVDAAALGSIPHGIVVSGRHSVAVTAI